MTVRNDKPVDASVYQQPDIEDLAARGAQAIQKMDVPTQDAMMEAVPGRAPDIGQSFHGRLLRRKPAELAKLIGETHLDTTTETSGRIAALKEAMSDEDVRATASALEAIAKKSGLSPGVFARFVQTLELVNEVAEAKGLAMIPGPTRMKIEALANGEAANLPRILGETLGRLGYEPLRAAVDTPS